MDDSTIVQGYEFVDSVDVVSSEIAQCGNQANIIENKVNATESQTTDEQQQQQQQQQGDDVTIEKNSSPKIDKDEEKQDDKKQATNAHISKPDHQNKDGGDIAHKLELTPGNEEWQSKKGNQEICDAKTKSQIQTTNTKSISSSHRIRQDSKRSRVPCNVVPDLGVLSFLPDSLKYLALYENPFVSMGVILTSCIFVALATYDIGVTLPFMMTRMLEAGLVISLGATVGVYVNDTYVNKDPYPKKTIVADILKPRMVSFGSSIFRFLDLGDDVLATSTSSGQPPSRGPIFLTIRLVHSLVRTYMDCVYCTSYVKTAKAIVCLHSMGWIASVFSFVGLFFLGVLMLFTVPITYKMNQESVDRVIKKYSRWLDVVEDFYKKVVPSVGKNKQI